MNILAHSFLSFGNQSLLIGNFIADHVKGAKLSTFSKAIQNGIIVHRGIDQFTDNHRLYKQSCHRIFKDQGHYSRVVIDIIYDHYLAKNWASYSEQSLEEYAQEFYELLSIHQELLPNRSQQMLTYMKSNNWLLMYRSIEGIDQILKGMHSRANYKSSMDTAAELIQIYDTNFQEEFSLFFNELILYSQDKIKNL